MLRPMSTNECMSPRALVACPRVDRYRNAQTWYVQIQATVGSKPAFMFADATHLARRLLERSP